MIRLLNEDDTLIVAFRQDRGRSVWLLVVLMALTPPTLTTAGAVYSNQYKADTLLLAEGANVASLTDAIGGKTLTALGTPPVFHPQDWPIGKQQISWSGAANQGLQAASAGDWTGFSNGNPWSILYFPRSAVFPPTGTYVIFDTSANGTGTGFCIKYIASTSSLVVLISNAGTLTVNWSWSSVLQTPAVHGVLITFDGTTVAAWDWDVSLGLGTNSGVGGGFSLGAPTNPLTVGYYSGAVLVGDLPEFLFVQGAAVNAVDRHALFAYGEARGHPAGWNGSTPSTWNELFLDFGTSVAAGGTNGMTCVYATSGLTQTITTFTKYSGNPITTGNTWDIYAAYWNVYYNAILGRYEALYSCFDSNLANMGSAYAYSSDGISWTKPTLNLAKYPPSSGTTTNNLIDCNTNGEAYYVVGVVYNPTWTPPSATLVSGTFSNGTDLTANYFPETGLCWILGTGAGSFVVSGGTVTGPGSNATLTAWIEVGVANYNFSIQIIVQSDGAAYGFMLRWTDYQNYLLLVPAQVSGTFILYEVINGSFTSLTFVAAGSLVVGQYCTIAGSLNGNVITATLTQGVNSYPLTWTTSQFAGSTKVGLYSYNASTYRVLSVTTISGTHQPKYLFSCGPNSGLGVDVQYIVQHDDGTFDLGNNPTIFGITTSTYIADALTFRASGKPFIYAQYLNNSQQEQRSLGIYTCATSNPSHASNWSGPFLLIAGSGNYQYYSACAPYKRGRLWVVPITIFSRAVDANGTTDMSLYVSPDEGYSNVLVEDHWIPNGVTGPDTKVMYGTSGYFNIGGQIYIWYSGGTVSHDAGTGYDNQLCLGFIPFDRWQALAPSGANGSVTCRAMYQSVANVNAIVVNADGTAGNITVALLDPQGNVITGFGDAQSTVVSAGTTGTTITWNGSTLPAGLYRPRFKTNGGNLYSYSVQQYAPPASAGIGMGASMSYWW
jgi:hypothetical protein